MDGLTIKYAQLTWALGKKVQVSFMKLTGTAREEKGLKQKMCWLWWWTGYVWTQWGIHMCIWISWSPPSLHRQEFVTGSKPDFLAFVKSFLLCSHPEVQGLQKSSPRHEFLQFLPPPCSCSAVSNVSAHVFWDYRVSDLTSKKAASYSVHAFFLLQFVAVFLAFV